jgi:hypothetical protein
MIYSKLWKSVPAVLLGYFLANQATAATIDAEELAAIKAEMAALKAQYEAQLTRLDKRLQQAELQLATQATTPSPPPLVNPSSATNALNPATSLVLIGNYAALRHDPADFAIPGFALPEEAGPGVRGFSLGESELTLSANIDDKFYGSLTASLSVEDGETAIDLEEAYFQTLALPLGLTLKGGRFFSRIGYLNETHPHADDFVDRPLAYQAMLNGTFSDDGLQLRWLAPIDQLLEFGAEAYRGDSYPAHGADDHGVGAYTLFAHLGDDLGAEWSYRVGASYVHAAAAERATGDLPDVFAGRSELAIVDAVFKWALNGNPAQTNLKLQAEFLRRWETGSFNAVDYDGTQHGFYLQTVYQFMPRWRIGARYDALYADSLGTDFAGTALDDLDHSPWRTSLLFEFDNSEFSRLRLQYTYDQVAARADHQLFLNYIYSLGAHGAHQF